MKEYEVTITEISKAKVTVEAESQLDAEQIASDMWHKGDIILDADNFVSVDFDSDDGKEIISEQENTMEVLMIEPGKPPKVETIGSDLTSMQKAVDGYIQALYPFDDPVAIIRDEEAKLNGKLLNRALHDENGKRYDIIAGKFFICGLSDENFASLPKELQKKYEDKFKQPEAFLKMGSKILAFPTEPPKPTVKKDKPTIGDAR